MTRLKRFFALGVGSVALLIAVLFLAFPAPPVGAQSASTNPPFDFSDSFYLQIDPATLVDRCGDPGPRQDKPQPDCVSDAPAPDATRREFRVLQTTGWFDASGNLIYCSIMAPVFPNNFTTDREGQQAREIADKFRAFLFPRDPDHDGNVVLSPAVPNRRQDNVFDTRDGYFSNNPLGLWVLAFVVYTEKAFTPEGQSRLAPIAAANGVDLDGTPILDDASTIDDLAQKGIVKILKRAADGSQGFPWVV